MCLRSHALSSDNAKAKLTRLRVPRRYRAESDLAAGSLRSYRLFLTQGQLQSQRRPAITSRSLCVWAVNFQSYRNIIERVPSLLKRLQSSVYPDLVDLVWSALSTMNNRPVEQALGTLVPTHANDLPQELLSLALNLVAQSRSFSSSLKPEEEIARPYACAEIACRRYVLATSTTR